MMKKLVFGILGIFILMQFIRPNFTNPNTNDALALHADDKVMGILKNSCYDCHSNETKYPWYYQTAPASWFIAEHVNEGRKALNFSQWSTIDSSTKMIRLKRAKQLITNGLMPIRSYALMHENTKLDSEQKEILEQFFDEQLQQLQKS